MKIIWTENSKIDLEDYKENSKKLNTDKYIESLINYVDTIKDFEKIGKFLFTDNNIEFRQLIYEMHRIFYAIDDDKVFILVISHTSRNTKNIINYLKKYFK